jgi:hypothetical protein
LFAVLARRRPRTLGSAPKQYLSLVWGAGRQRIDTYQQPQVNLAANGLVSLDERMKASTHLRGLDKVSGVDVGEDVVQHLGWKVNDANGHC